MLYESRLLIFADLQREWLLCASVELSKSLSFRNLHHGHCRDNFPDRKTQLSELCSNDDIYDVDDIKKKNYENGYYEYIIKT